MTNGHGHATRAARAVCVSGHATVVTTPGGHGPRGHMTTTDTDTCPDTVDTQLAAVSMSMSMSTSTPLADTPLDTDTTPQTSMTMTTPDGSGYPR